VSFVAGLTGGIGSGKSAVAERLAARGASVVDTDEIARALAAPGGAAMPALSAAFGPSFVRPDGGLDRDAMRRLAFADPAARAKLEAILHPLIRAECARRLAGADGPYAVLVVPLLFESGAWADRVDRVVAVDCDGALQVARAAARPGLDESAVRAVMAAQWPRWRRLQMADEVVWNGGTLEALDRACGALDERLRAAAGRSPARA
jgi:dephospho-CoA kinase